MPAVRPGYVSGRRFAGGKACLRGYTLVELVSVIVIAGILAAIILPRFTGETGFEARQFRDETVAALRFAQKSAIAARRKVCATFAANQVSFTMSAAFNSADCSGGPAYYGPDGKTPVTVTAPRGVAFSTFPASLVFDAAGSPDAGVTVKVGGLPDAQAITVENGTGYVH